MWHKINHGIAKNDEGVKITRSGYRTVTYGSSIRAITIDVDAGQRNLGIYARSISKWTDGANVTSDDREGVLHDVEEAFQVLQIPIEILWV